MYSNCLFVALAIMVFFNNDTLLSKYGKRTCDVRGLLSFILFLLSFYFDKTIFPFALVAYGMIIANLTVRALLVRSYINC